MAKKSKNSKTNRSSAPKPEFNGRQIEPIQCFLESKSYMTAKYVGTSEVVLGTDGTPMSWNQVLQQVSHQKGISIIKAN
jgi:hypothetical protein